MVRNENVLLDPNSEALCPAPPDPNSGNLVQLMSSLRLMRVTRVMRLTKVTHGRG